MFKMLLPFVALRLNLFPVSTRTDFLSAFQILYNRPAEADKDCHLEFGALYHVTARDTVNSNSMTSRTYAAIGVGQIPNGTRTCNFYMLHNQQDRDKITHTTEYIRHGRVIPDIDSSSSPAPGCLQHEATNMQLDEPTKRATSP